MNYKDYYTALGQIVYATAMADGSIQQEEVNKIFNFVVAQLVEIERETGNGNEALKAFYTEKEFHRLRNQNKPIKEAYQEFIKFIDENLDELDDKMKNTCINLIEKVAIAYNGIEDSEQVLIEKVKRQLNKL
ncbi:MAG: hypothetical protein K9H16_13075 [Bacteroidales bacterium]|nr:hypothetical protein [Bacteroidales bacterium]